MDINTGAISLRRSIPNNEPTSRSRPRLTRNNLIAIRRSTFPIKMIAEMIGKINKNPVLYRLPLSFVSLEIFVSFIAALFTSHASLTFENLFCSPESQNNGYSGQKFAVRIRCCLLQIHPLIKINLPDKKENEMKTEAQALNFGKNTK